MEELLELSFTPANILPTIFLLLVVLYWCVFLVGLLDLSFLDVDMSHGDDLPTHLPDGKDFSHNAQLDADHVGFGNRLMGFFNLGYVPLMVIFSFFALFYWAISILGNHYLARGMWGLNLLILVGGLFGAALLAKFATQPLRRLFRHFNDEESELDLRGKICEIELGPEGERIGQAFLVIGSKNISIHVRSENGQRIPPRTKVVVLERSAVDESYIVTPLDTAPENSP